MNIDYTSLKLNNFLQIIRYPNELKTLLNEYFSDFDELEKEVQISNVLTFLGKSQDRVNDLKRVCEMLSKKEPSCSGFIYGLSGISA